MNAETAKKWASEVEMMEEAHLAFEKSETSEQAWEKIGANALDDLDFEIEDFAEQSGLTKKQAAAAFAYSILGRYND